MDVMESLEIWWELNTPLAAFYRYWHVCIKLIKAVKNGRTKPFQAFSNLEAFL